MKFFNRWLWPQVADLAFSLVAVARLPKFIASLAGPDGARMWRERRGFLPPELGASRGGRFRVWIHAVSVGEVRAAASFVKRLRERQNDCEIVFSTVTPSGQAQARALVAGSAHVIYFPFDWRSSVTRALDTVCPDLVLLVETEFWPNWLSELHARGIPVGVLNGRVSERSFAGYRFLKGLFAPLLGNLAFALAQTQLDRERLIALGVREASVTVTGNMKFDAFGEPAEGQARREHVRSLLSPLRPIWIAGSTHEGEEKILAGAFRRLRSRFPALRWVLAPRHIDRAPALRAFLGKEGFKCACSRDMPSEPVGVEWDVLIVDEFGMLASLYESADVAFVGGSLVRRGGQNPIEPARAGVPVVTGPHVFNFQAVYGELARSGAAVVVENADALVRTLGEFLEDPQLREQAAGRARACVEALSGATDRNVSFVLEAMKHEKSRGPAFASRV